MLRLLVLLILIPQLLALCVRADERVPFPVDWNQIDQSVLDLNRFLDAPAGKHGFIHPQGEHLIDERGERFRVWGVNLGGPACFPDHDDAEKLADALARFGINCVRFHGLDSSWGRSSIDRSADQTSRLDPRNMERFDYLFDQMRRRGIYANINLNTFRTYGAQDGVPNPSDLGLGKWATHFYPRLIELQEKYASDLLSHVNPYTGCSYANDPAVLVVEIVNENSLAEGWLNWKLIGKDDASGDTWSPLPVAYADELDRQFNDWLHKHRSNEQMAAYRAEANVAADQPLTLLRPDQFRAVSKQRFAADYEFIVSTERAYLQRMKTLIKDNVGLKSMLIGDADHNDSINGYPHIVNNAIFDYIDGHGYWQHPSIGNVTRTKNDPMVNDPGDSTVVQFARSPMTGMPYIVSETNHPYPHPYEAEGIPILTAYALLHDWDGVVFHQWGHAFYENSNSIPRTGWFQLSVNPMKVAGLYVAGLMWHRHDVRSAEKLVIREMTSQQMCDRSRLESWQHRPFFDDEFPKTLPLVSRTRWKLSQQPIEPKYPPNPEPGNLVSDTKELRWHDADRKRGRVVIDTPRTQALIGFQRDDRNRNYRGSTNLSVDIKQDFAAVVLTSLDDQPITSSKRMLLFVGDRAANEDLTWQDDFQTVATWGEGPVAIRPVNGKISLWGLDGGTELTATVLGPVGQPSGKQWTTYQSDNGWHLIVGDPAGLMAIIQR